MKTTSYMTNAKHIVELSYDMYIPDEEEAYKKAVNGEKMYNALSAIKKIVTELKETQKDQSGNDIQVTYTAYEIRELIFGAITDAGISLG